MDSFLLKHCCPQCKFTSTKQVEYVKHWEDNHRRTRGQTTPNALVKDFKNKENEPELDLDYEADEEDEEEKEHEQKQSRRKRMRLDDASIDHEIIMMKLDSVTTLMDKLTDTLCAIDKSNIDNHTKDVMKHMAMSAVSPDLVSTKIARPVVISALVQEHLGYLPKVVNIGKEPVNKMYMLIGKMVQKEYMKLYGKAPKKRVYNDGKVSRETNDYSSSDRGWISEIVKQVCELNSVYPRPRVAMARGELVRSV
jgi:hypothetical protein